MKILVLSDLIAEFEIFYSTYLHQAIRHRNTETQADVVVLAGDIYTKGRDPNIKGALRKETKKWKK